MDEQLKQLKLKRKNCKSQLTLFEKFLSNLDHSNLSDVDSVNLWTRLVKIETILDVFIELQNEIDCLQTSEGNVNIEELERFQNNYFKCTSEARDILKKSEDIKTASLGLISDQENFNVRNSPTQSRKNIKLPTIKLPRFDGNFTSWREFYDNFKSIINDNVNLTNVEKLQYLRSSLEGEPLSMLKGLETTERNYDIAWNNLIKHYNNKRRIINNHVQALIQFPPIAHENYLSLKNLYRTVQTQVQCLESLSQPVNEWDAILVPILLSKLDFQTAKEWDVKQNNDQTDNDVIPTYNEFLLFLNCKISTLESITLRKKEQSKGNTQQQQHVKTSSSRSFATLNISCSYCQGNHFIQNCEAFSKLAVGDRNNKVRELKLCINCLRKGHFMTDCQSKMSCKKCHKRHHTLLHSQVSKQDIKTESVSACNSVDTGNNHECSGELNVVMTNYLPNVESQVILSTAKVYIFDSSNRLHEVRVLLDSASQSNFISERICDILKLKRQPIDVHVTGINHAMLKISSVANVKMKSSCNNYTANVSCLVIPKITNLPAQPIDIRDFQIPVNITLADSTFSKPSPIDMLIGASLFYDLLCIGQIKTKNGPIFQKTVLGWIISGAMSAAKHSNNSVSCLTLNELHNDVQRFWQLDEFSSEKHLTDEEEYCENYFKQTTTRHESGRFVVCIPFKPNLKDLGDSHEIAESRFKMLERRLERDTVLKANYTGFMNEYKDLNHMTKISDNVKHGFYLPHHPVIKEESETTKLRVVFDGSCKPSIGISINEAQHVGPTVQSELFSILARFRLHKYVITADIAKMYRQILIHPEERKFQKILWRSNPNDTLDTYELNTVTYGTTSAPFLATRSLMQIALECESSYPIESQIIKKDFYVDDLLTGTNSLEDLVQIKNNIELILNSAGFNLRKWNSNVQQLCGSQSSETHHVNLSNDLHKTLGVYWNCVNDYFSYNTSKLTNHAQITKRTILATTAQLFDPLGLLAPVIILAKMILQELWQLNLKWDESLPMNLSTRWLKFKGELDLLNGLKISRQILINDPVVIELHAFSDASERAYGTCIYVRSLNINHEVTVRLLAAKSRVAPVKYTTLPRLELCAAVLSARLVDKFRAVLGIQNLKEFYWCDSQIVLCWLKSSTSRWKTYVANRVSEIQTLSDPSNWYYVKSASNPSDLISRGVLPGMLIKSTLWWHGPNWLSHENFDFREGNPEILNVDHADCESKVHTLQTTVESPSILLKYSSLTKLTHIIALCLRFKDNCRLAKPLRRLSPLSVEELNNALAKIIKMVQFEFFSQEIQELQTKGTIHPKSKILPLSPILDNVGILRVGGRLQLSEFDYDKRHPILLPKRHHITDVIFRLEHNRLLHAGPNLLLHSVRQKYWPIDGRTIAKRIVRECLKCFRHKAKPVCPLMGALPKERTMIIYPFHTAGVDYAGPFLLRDRKGRGSKTVTKAYICLFICFSIKAIHLELVTDLTTEAFMAAFKRFISRRGKPSQIFSDNATNFVGARNELNKLRQFFENNSDSVTLYAANEGIQWHFIPPHSPHFGGLWEAGVKSVKHHLKRVMSNNAFTYDELYTVLTQIEAILNSRPLTPLSSEPTDCSALTPAHFLIGRTYTSLPDPDLHDKPINRLGRYQFLQQIVQHFWNKWKTTYINELQMRRKWKTNKKPLEIGNLVLLKDDNSPPAKWLLGRVIDLHPGQDGIPRVATVKCGNIICKRAVAKLCVLPI